MISTAGAGLIAVIIPVGLLVLVVELRRTLLTLAISFKRRPVRLIASLFLFVATIGSTASLLVCVTSVSSGQAIRGWLAIVVFVSGWALMLVVGCAVSFTVGKMTFLIFRGASEEEIKALDS